MRGNINWMFARQALFKSKLFGDDIKKLVPWVMEHRLVMKRESDMGGVTGRQVLEEILRTIEVP